jgi:surface antigen
MMNRRALALIAVTLAAASPWALAAGWGAVLRDSPAEDFDDEDSRLFLAAIKQVLEAPLPPQPLEWRNDASGAGGTLLVVGQPKRPDFGECRRVRATLYSKKRKGGSSVWTACKDASGRWKLVSVG